MRGEMFWLMVALGVVLRLGSAVNAELYLWTDERGVVHMTDQWANVPESARSRVSVRESSAAPQAGPLGTEHATRPVEPVIVEQPPSQMAPDLVQTPASPEPTPPLVVYPRESFGLIPSHRPFIHHPKKPSPPFPYNVALIEYPRIPSPIPVSRSTNKRNSRTAYGCWNNVARRHIERSPVILAVADGENQGDRAIAAWRSYLWAIFVILVVDGCRTHERPMSFWKG
jgi:hypothetical protein